MADTRDARAGGAHAEFVGDTPHDRAGSVGSASADSMLDEVDPDGSLLSSMLARQALMDSPLPSLERDSLRGPIQEEEGKHGASATHGPAPSPLPPAGPLAGRSQVSTAGSSLSDVDLGAPWRADDDPDDLEDAITAAQASQVHHERSAFARRSRRRSPGGTQSSGLGDTGAMTMSLTQKSTASMVVKELYPSVEKDLYSPDYWTHWNSEAVKSKEAAVMAQDTLHRRKQQAKEESRRGMKGVKLAVQWRLDHPFRKPNKFGKGTGSSAFLDSEAPKCPFPEKDYLSEFRLPPQKPPLPQGGRFSETGREDLDRVAAAQVNQNVGPGLYRVPNGLGRQPLSRHRSAPSFQISGADFPDPHKTDSPGPKYLPKWHPKIHGNTPSIRFPTSERDQRPRAEAPGPKYKVGNTIGKTGPAFSFSVGGDSRRGKEAYMNPEKPSPPRPTEAHAGFGYGCNVEEHVKFGHCLDGRCSTRSNWEGIRKRYADEHTRMVRTLQRDVQTAEGEARDTLADTSASSPPQLGEASPSRTVPRSPLALPPHPLVNAAMKTDLSATAPARSRPPVVPPRSAPGAVDTQASGVSTGPGSSVGGSSAGRRRRRRKKKAQALRADGAPRESAWMAVRWTPPDDIFQPFCEHCGKRVDIMTRHERIMATNRALQKHAAPFVSHMAMPGPKKGRLAGSGRDSARSIISLNSIASHRSNDTMASVRSRLTRRSGSTRSYRNSPRGSIGDSFSFGDLSSGSSRRGRKAKSKASVARSGVSQLYHDPAGATYIPGCGYFCGPPCVRHYVLSNVGTGSATDAVKSRKNIVRPAVTHCVKANNLEQLSFLLRNGSDIHLLADNRQGMLHLAAADGHVRILDRLFCGAFNVLMYQTCNRHHPQGCACYNQRLDVNTTDIDGSTPLHIASQKGKIHAIERLLEAGADPEILDFSGRAPHDIAVNQECYAILKNAVAITDAADHLRTFQLSQYDLLRKSGKVAHTETPQLLDTGIGRHGRKPDKRRVEARHTMSSHAASTGFGGGGGSPSHGGGHGGGTTALQSAFGGSRVSTAGSFAVSS